MTSAMASDAVNNAARFSTPAEEQYWSQAVAEELRRIALNTEEGDRNFQFFRSACAIFAIVKGGLGSKAAAEELLIEAATESGYADDEPEQMMATLASAWKTASPRDIVKSPPNQAGAAPKETEPSPPRGGVRAITLVPGADPVSHQAEEVMKAFALRNEADPVLFSMSNVITRLRHDEITGTRLEPLDKDALRHEIDRVVHFRTKQGIYTAVPASVVSNIAGAPAYELPIIRGLRHAPYFAADGRLVDRAGFDSGTGYFLDMPRGLQIPRVSEFPSICEIRRALRELQDVIMDFPFRDPASKRTYLGLLLLPFCRDLIEGPTPIYIFAKPAPGTGGSLAVDLFSILSTGRAAAAQAEAENSAEFRKNITAFLMSGASYYYLDNLHQSLDDPAFAAALTAGVWRDRVLGKSEMVDIPIRNTWIVTGNNPKLSEETARRSALIELDAQVADPSSRTKFRHPELRDYVRDRRGVLIHACLTLIQSWVVERRHFVTAAGVIVRCDPTRTEEFLARAEFYNAQVIVRKRAPGGARLASFDGWARTISGILEGAGVKGLLANRTRLKARTVDTATAFRDFVSIWYATHGEKDVRVGSLRKGGASDHYGTLADQGTLVELLYMHKGEIDLGFNGRAEGAWQGQLGSALSSAEERVFAITENTGRSIEVRIVKRRARAGVAYRLQLVDEQRRRA